MDAKISYQILMKEIESKKLLIDSYVNEPVKGGRRLAELRAELQELELQEYRFKVVDDD